MWYDILRNDRKVDNMTDGVWSEAFGSYIVFALISREFNAGDTVSVIVEKQVMPATLHTLPLNL